MTVDVRPSTGTRPAVRRPDLAATLLLVASLLACLVAAPQAVHAHGGNPNFRSVIDRTVPEVEGLELAVHDYDSDIRLTAPAGTRVTIPGYWGEPYVRILGDGSVEVNRRSPSAYLSTDRYAEVEVPERADAGAEPSWETVRTDGTFQWHDHRSHWMSREPPAQLEGVTERTEVFEYEIPVRVGGEPVRIEGTLYWVGPEQGSPLPFVLGGVGVLFAAGAGTLIVRRRRAGNDELDSAAPGRQAR